VALLLLVFETTPLDSAISGWFFDPVAGVFPLRYDFAIEVLGHQAAKLLVVVLACCVIALYLLTFVLPDLKAQRRVLLFLSHILWSGWVCWLVILVLYVALIGPGPKRVAAINSTA